MVTKYIQNIDRPPAKLDVIVSTGWHRVGYNIIRSLGRKGLKVGLADSSRFCMSALSRYTSAFIHYPSYETEPTAFIERMKETLGIYKPSVFIPSDEEVFVIASHKELFRGLSTIIPIAGIDTLRVLNGKDESSRLAASLGIPVPETICPADAADIIHFAKDVGMPIVLKKINSSGSEGVFFLGGDDLPANLSGTMINNDLTFGNFIVQQYVKGEGYGVSMLFNEGSLRAKFTHRRLREKSSTGGTSTLRMSTRNPVLEKYAERLMEHVSYHGVAMVEFKYNEDTGQGWLIEVNPRFWGSLALAVRAGVDFPYLIYRMALEGDVEPCLSYRENVRVKWFLGDMATALRRLGGASPSAAYPSGRIDGYDDVYWDDLLPLGGEILSYLLKLVRRKPHRDRVKEGGYAKQA